jgi:hypothetical protein
MRVETDDASRRLRFLWLGPVGWRFPFDARFTAWGLVTGLGSVFTAVFVVIGPTTALKAAGVPVGFLMALALARAVMPHVDHDRPVRYHRATFSAELRAPRPATRGHHVRVRLDPDVFDRTETLRGRTR